MLCPQHKRPFFVRGHSVKHQIQSSSDLQRPDAAQTIPANSPEPLCLDTGSVATEQQQVGLTLNTDSCQQPDHVKQTSSSAMQGEHTMPLAQMTDDQSASRSAGLDTIARTINPAGPVCDNLFGTPSSAAELPNITASHQAATGECWFGTALLGCTDEESVIPPILHAALAEALKADAPALGTDLGLAAAATAAGEVASKLVTATEATAAALDDAVQTSVPEFVPETDIVPETDDDAHSMPEQDGMSPTSVVQPTPSEWGSMSAAPSTLELLAQSPLPLQVCTA